MRIQVELDDELFHMAQIMTGTKTEKEVIREALVILIRLREQTQVRDLRGKLN